MGCDASRKKRMKDKRVSWHERAKTAVVEYLCDILFYGVLGAAWCVYTLMVEYDGEVWTTCAAYVLFTP